MRNQCPFTEEQLRLFEKYARDPMNLKRPVRQKTARLFEEYQHWKAYDARRPESGVILTQQDYDDTRFPGESRESNKPKFVFVRPQTDREQAGREYWYFYPEDAKSLRTKRNSGKAVVGTAIVLHFLAWNIYRKVYDRLNTCPWEKRKVWLPRHQLADMLDMSEAEVREATDRACPEIRDDCPNEAALRKAARRTCPGGLILRFKEHRDGSNHTLFYRIVDMANYFRTRKNGKQYRVRVDLAKEHGFTAACLWENQFIWTRRALELVKPDDNGVLFCGQKMTDLEQNVYEKIFTRSEMDKALRRLVKAGLLVKRVDGVALPGSRNVRYYSLPASEIARLQAEVRANETEWQREAEALVPPEIMAEVEQECRAEIDGIVPLEAVLVDEPVEQVVTNLPGPALDPAGPGLDPAGPAPVEANLPGPVVPEQLSLDEMDEYQDEHPKNEWFMSNPPVEKPKNLVPKKSEPKSQIPSPESQILYHRIGYPGVGRSSLRSDLPHSASNTTQRAGEAAVAAEPLPGRKSVV